MWVRDEAKPTPYGGVEFRSALEARVAEQFDVLGVDWRYEVKPHEAVSWFSGSYEPDPPPVTGYLPDFTVMDAPEDLQLPLWVEVKPAELLYAVRDHLGCPERFDSDFVSDINATQIHEANLTEIWKPKRLAEFYERDVLVVYQINRNRTLSILMQPDRVVLSRRHPAVNYRQVVADREKAEREARWRAQREAEDATRKREHAQLVAEWVHHVRQNGRPARYDGRCLLCGTAQPATAILIAQSSDGAWRALCRSHIQQSERGPA